MKCRYCNTALAPMRTITDGEFCCDGHRTAFSAENTAASEPVVPVRPAEPEVSAAVRMLRLKFSTPLASAPPPPPPEEPVESAPEIPEPVLEETVEMPVEELQPEAEPEPEIYAETYAAEAIDDVASEPIEASEETIEVAETEPEPAPGFHPAREAARSWKWIRTTWNAAPRDLKLVTVVLPVLAALAVTGSFPKVPIKAVVPPAPVAEVQKAVNEHWKNFTQQVSNRAAIAYADDFRSGLDAWESRSNLTTSWSYDAAGFVHPGPLGLFRPIDRSLRLPRRIPGRNRSESAIGWAFRAEDLKNYYADEVCGGEARPAAAGRTWFATPSSTARKGRRFDKPLPMTVRADMLYRV